MKIFWMTVAALGGASALFFAVRDDYEKAFIAATIGVVAWFLNYRVQLRDTLRKIDDDEEEQS